MTLYEIQDLIATYVDNAMTRVRFWVSVTFAVIAAAYVVGEDLDTSLMVFILIVYAYVTVVAWGITRVAMLRAKSLVDMECDMVRDEETQEQFVPALVRNGARPDPALFHGLFVVGFVGTFAYVLISAGVF